MAKGGSKRAVKRVVGGIARRAKPQLLRFGAESLMALQGMAIEGGGKAKFNLLVKLLAARAKQTGSDLARHEINLLGEYLVTATKKLGIDPEDVSNTAGFTDADLIDQDGDDAPGEAVPEAAEPGD